MLEESNLNNRHILKAEEMILNRGHKQALKDAKNNYEIFNEPDGIFTSKRDRETAIFWRAIVEYLETKKEVR